MYVFGYGCGSGKIEAKKPNPSYTIIWGNYKNTIGGSVKLFPSDKHQCD